MKRLFAVFFIIIFCTMAVQAEDDMGNPNNPDENDRANACYDEGSLEGICDTAWEWECGWYLIRFEDNMIPREEFPNWCFILLPPEIELELVLPVIPTGAGCQAFLGGFVFFSSDFLPVGAVTYASAACVTPNGTTALPLVYTTGGMASAATICTNNGLAFGGAISGNIYHCM